jgi:hypothetical protein
MWVKKIIDFIVVILKKVNQTTVGMKKTVVKL